MVEVVMRNGNTHVIGLCSETNQAKNVSRWIRDGLGIGWYSLDTERSGHSHLPLILVILQYFTNALCRTLHQLLSYSRQHSLPWVNSSVQSIFHLTRWSHSLCSYISGSVVISSALLQGHPPQTNLVYLPYDLQCNSSLFLLCSYL